MKKLILSLALMVCAVAQTAPDLYVQVRPWITAAVPVSPEMGGAVPQRSGQWVAVWCPDPAVDAFRVTLRYQTSDGVATYRTQLAQREYRDGLVSPWTNTVFEVGDVKVLQADVATLSVTGGKTFEF